MDIAISETGIPAVIRMRGEIDLYSAKKIRDAFEQLSMERRTKVLVDLSQVDYIDSTGVGAFLEGHRRMQKEGGGLRFVGMRDSVLKVIRLVQLDKHFELHDTEQEAREAFEGLT